MADRRISTGTLTDIANAIRSKTGKSALITPQEMASEIESIETGGGGNANVIDLSDSSLWENKDFSSGSAVGTAYANTKSSSTTRITLIEPIPLTPTMIFTYYDYTYTLYFLLFDENKKYIGWSSGSWTSQTSYKSVVIKDSIFVKKSGSKVLADAKYIGIDLQNSNQAITPTDTSQLHAICSDVALYN